MTVDLAAVLRCWSLDGASLSYLRKGAGNRHWSARSEAGDASFVVVDDLEAKPWVARDRQSTFEGLRTAYDTARALSVADDLEFVVAPLPSNTGALCIPLSEQHTVAVFPFVAGEPGTWGDPLGEGERLELPAMLARLHQASSGRATLRRQAHDLSGRAELLAALDALDMTWDGGPFGDPARRALRPRASWVESALARFDRLGAQLEGSDAGRVVTHGEPHPGNLIRTEAGLRLIDWDTAALAEPERDLWMLDAACWSSYEARTGTRVDPDAVELYRLTWTLSDVAWLAHRFRGEHRQSAWAARKLAAFVALLERGAAMPWETG